MNLRWGPMRYTKMDGKNDDGEDLPGGNTVPMVFGLVI